MDLATSKQKEIYLLNTTQNLKKETISFLKNKEDSLLRVLSEKKLQTEKISKEILSIIANTKKTENKLTPELQLISTNFAKNKGRLPWTTAQGSIISKFGEVPHPVLSGITIINNGIEITTQNIDVRTVFNGEVAKIIVLPNGLKGVIINHGDYFTVYSNLAKVTVNSGEKLTTKDNIGELYNKDSKKRNVLGFQIWQSRKKLNPQQWLSSY